MDRLTRTVACSLLATLEASSAWAGDGVEADLVGVSIGVGVASAYIFRGANLLQARSPRDQHAVVQPTLVYDIPSTDLTVAYFSSYQVSGPNRAVLVADGTGDEQEGASATASAAVDLGFGASFMAGIQDVIRPSSYLYLNPTVGRGLALAEVVWLEATTSYGYKVQRERDNTHDLGFELSVTYSPTARLDDTPAAHWAWTNLEGRELGEEQVVWASVEIGARL